MARSNNRLAVLDGAALAGITVGILAYVVPAWSEGRLEFAFWLTLAATVLHIYTSHKAAHTSDEVGGS